MIRNYCDICDTLLTSENRVKPATSLESLHENKGKTHISAYTKFTVHLNVTRELERRGDDINVDVTDICLPCVYRILKVEPKKQS